MTRKRTKAVKDDLTLQLELQMAELEEKKRELEELPKRILAAKLESEMTMPPMEWLKDRKRAKDHEQALVTRGEVQNVVREHNHSLIMLILLLACTASLAWWGIQLIR